MHTSPFLIASLLLLSGCASTSRFSVDATRNGEANAAVRTSYRIVSTNPELSDDDARVATALNSVKTALSSKGWFEAPSGAAADMTIEVDFGMGPPVTHVVREVNLAVQIPAYAVPAARPRTSPAPDWYRTFNSDGYLVTVTRTTLREKFLRVTARENVAGSDVHVPERELWSVYVTNDDASNELESKLPMLVAAAMDSFGTNATNAHEVALSARDARVAFVERGL